MGRPAFTLCLLTGLNLFNYLDRQILAAVLTPVKTELDLSDAQLGWVSTAFMLGYFLTSPLFGYLGDRFPRRGLVLAGVVVWSVGTFLTGLAGTFAWLVAFRVLVGVGEASYGTISPGWIADLYPAAKRNNALAIFAVAIPVGSALGYILGSQLGEWYGWRVAFYAAGLPGVFLAFTLLLAPEPRRGAMEPPTVAGAPVEALPTGLAAWRALLGFPHYVLAVLGYIAQTFALGGFAFWAPTFLHRVHGMSTGDAGKFFGLSLVATGLCATLIGGFAATAWRKRNAAAYGWVLAISALASVPAAAAAFMLTDLDQARAMMVLAMFCLFLSTGPISTLTLESVPVGLRNTATAASIFAIHLFGDLCSPQIIGFLSDWRGLSSAVLILPVALLVSAFFWGWLALAMQRAARTAGPAEATRGTAV